MRKCKCKKCIWSDVISKDLAFCLFPCCVRKKEKKDDKASGNI